MRLLLPRLLLGRPSPCGAARHCPRNWPIVGLQAGGSSASSSRGYYSGDAGQLPLLCPGFLPVYTKRSFYQLTQNWIFANLIIAPYMDHEFSQGQFQEGAEAAVERVSDLLASGDVLTLLDSGLVSEECAQEVTRSLSLYSEEQRKCLRVKRSGILDSFIYQIGMMMEDDLTRRNEQTGYYHQIREDTDGRADGRPGCERKALHAEITYVGLFNQRYSNRRVVVNYRFIRNLTSGVEDDWTVNAINHAVL